MPKKAHSVESVPLNWGSLAVSKYGSGRPLVLVHGFPMDHRMWSRQTGEFAGWQTVAPDVRGMGQSPAREPAGAMSDYADDLAALLDLLDLQQAVFVGLSMGGYILFEMWRRHPDRVSGLALICTRATPDDEVAKRGRLEAKRRVQQVGTKVMAEQMPAKLLGSSAGPPVVQSLRKMIVESPPDGVIAALDAMRTRSDSSPLLETISVPTIVIAGADDQIVSATDMKGMASRISGSQFRQIKNAGHVPPLEQPGEFNAALGAFLAAF